MTDAFARNPNAPSTSSAWEKHVGVTEAMTSDDPIGPSPYTTSDRETRIAYRVKRSANTSINGYPDAILYNGKTKLVTVNAGKPEDARWLEIIEASLYKRVTGMRQDEEMELYPRLKLTISTELGKPPRIVAMTPQGMSDTDRDHDRRRRDIFAAEKLAAELHVGNVTHIIRKHIIAPLVPDLKAATDEIRALHGAEGHSFDPTAIVNLGLLGLDKLPQPPLTPEETAELIESLEPAINELAKAQAEADAHMPESAERRKAREKRQPINPDHWSHNTAKRNGFYANLADKGFNRYDVHPSLKSRLIHDGLSKAEGRKIEHLEETSLDPAKAEQAVLAHIRSVYEKESTVTVPTTTKNFPAEVASLITDAFPLASSDYKLSIVKTATGHTSIAAAKEAGMDEARILADIGNEIATIKNVEKNLPDNTPQDAQNGQSASGTADKFELDPFLTEAKTLMGIPATRIQEFINRRYEDWAYSKTKAPGGKQWTVIDPIAVRQRFDKVFGPHGIGWRIVPAPNGSHVSVTPFNEQTKSGERPMYAVTLAGYCLEYRLRIGGDVEWQRTSAFTDSNDSEDLGYAGGGAFSSLMKQALKMLGGYDHFIVAEKKAVA